MGIHLFGFQPDRPAPHRCRIFHDLPIPCPFSILTLFSFSRKGLRGIGVIFTRTVLGGLEGRWRGEQLQVFIMLGLI